VPNAFPFKDQVLAEREELRRRREEERQRKRKGEVSEVVSMETNGGEMTNGKGKGENGFVPGLQVDSDEDVMDGSEEEVLSDEEEEEFDDDDDEDEGEEDDDDKMVDAESSDSEWGGIESDDEVSDVETLTQVNTFRNSTQPPYIKAIVRSDLLIFVLDARAPDITRSLEIEAFAVQKRKQCIFVLNRAGSKHPLTYTNP
jgi:nuclear GTP-binding protein